MKFSESFIFTQRQDPKIAECKSLKLLLKGNYLAMISSGIYSYLPLGFRVLSNINQIIRKHMNSFGAQELLMSALQPVEIWQKTGRDKDLAEVMFKFKDRKKRELCLGPTHEEEITEIVRRSVFSYKQLPFILYQIQAKFRDEPRMRFGLMRSCEFIMKDAYSFDEDEKGLDKNYQKMLAAYKKIFKDCGLNFLITEADSGAMGGSVSHEFMVPSDIGEDSLDGKKMIELGHIFQLGTKYSAAQEALFLDRNGKRRPLVMGCYGIGVSRILSAIAEINSDQKGIIWPKKISPFDLTLVVLDDKLHKEAFALEASLEKEGFSLLVDDRKEPAGVKFNDAGLIGNPYLLVMGKNYSQDKKLDIEDRKTGKSVSLTKDQVVKFLKKEYDR
jgi:prolyl-tRNA synthetase